MEEKLSIHGGLPLVGEVRISGAKNAALKQLAACLLCPEKVVLHNIPHLVDITLMMQLLTDLGCDVALIGQHSFSLNCTNIDSVEVPYSLVKAMRASVVVLGPLLSRFHEAKVSLPGGCAIGSRPINIHLDGLKAMGAHIELKEGFISATAKAGLQGAEFTMPMVTVTGTENLMMAAVLANGTTVLHNAAREPAVADLAHFLNAMGAKISGIGTATLTIEGVKQLHGTEYSVMGDRIEAGTYLVAGAMTNGDVTTKGVQPEVMLPIVEKLKEAGAKVTCYDDAIRVDMQEHMLHAVMLETEPYPGFPTDMQAQFMALNCVASGVGMITETIFENRFMHVDELKRLGASIRVNGDVVLTAGVHKLMGAPVMASDLRAAACLVLAGLVAEGHTVIEGLHHMDRGYEFLEEKLLKLGAEIERIIQ